MRLQNLLIVFYLSTFHCHAESIYISDFSNPSLNDWQHKSFKKYTQYQIVNLDKQAVLQAISTATASSLYKEVQIDLQKTP